MSVAVSPPLDLPGLESLAVEPGVAKHERLRDYFVAQISQGRLAPGSLLPSELRLAESLQIARSTVRQALATLEREGRVRDLIRAIQKLRKDLGYEMTDTVTIGIEGADDLLKDFREMIMQETRSIVQSNLPQELRHEIKIDDWLIAIFMHPKK